MEARDWKLERTYKEKVSARIQDWHTHIICSCTNSPLKVQPKAPLLFALNLHVLVWTKHHNCSHELPVQLTIWVHHEIWFGRQSEWLKKYATFKCPPAPPKQGFDFWKGPMFCSWLLIGWGKNLSPWRVNCHQFGVHRTQPYWMSCESLQYMQNSSNYEGRTISNPSGKMHSCEQDIIPDEPSIKNEVWVRRLYWLTMTNMYPDVRANARRWNPKPWTQQGGQTAS